MQSLPKISVVTVCFNSQHTIRQTIESVIQQSYSNYEHIIVDGGSKDGTLDILKEFPHLLWISEKDRGVYDAMNKGVRRATGEVVVMLNSDDCFLEDSLAHAARAFGENPEWDALFGDIIYIDGEGNEIFRRQEATFDYDVLRYSGVCYVIHQTLFVRKALHDKLGLYDSVRYLSCADFDFILKMGRAKCRVGHVPFYLVRFRYHQYGQSADLRMTQNIARERMQIMQEHGFPPGRKGRLLNYFYRGKRQFQKLLIRGRCDLIPGHVHLRKHMRERTAFTSNAMPKQA